LTLRYRRRVLPDELDARLTQNRTHDKFRKLAKTVEEYLEAILYSVDPETELTDVNEFYTLSIVLLVDSDSLIDDAVYEALDEATDKMQELFDRCAGLKCTVSWESDGTMTIAQSKGFDNWGFEDLSIETDVHP
jgi:hypothetical protein